MNETIFMMSEKTTRLCIKVLKAHMNKLIHDHKDKGDWPEVEKEVFLAHGAIYYLSSLIHNQEEN